MKRHDSRAGKGISLNKIIIIYINNMLKNNEESNGIMRIKLNSPSDDGINVEYGMRKSVKEQLNMK